MQQRIQYNPTILLGKPTIRGTRIPVYLILNLIKNGYTLKKIRQAYPELRPADIRAALEFAERSMEYEEEFIRVGRIEYAK